MWLTDFLLARIEEDQAHLVMHRAQCVWVQSDTYGECTCGGDARVLAECEAKRRLIAWTVENAPSYDMECGGDMEREVLWRLALPYSDHPDYDESWRL